MEAAQPFRRSRAEADLIRTCAALHGVSSRSVRSWRTHDDPRWRSFIRERAAVAAAQPGLALGPFVAITPEEEERAASARFGGLQSLADRALERGDHLGAERILKAAEASHRLLTAVRAARLAYDCEAKQLAAAEVERVVAVSRRIAASVKTLPEMVASAANPDNPAVAACALRAWLSGPFADACREILQHPNETTPAES
ncbi:MAG: hypothetical protein ACOYOL_05140 [Chthoniobacterales bacterium]